MKYTKQQVLIIIIVAITSFMGTFLISSVNIALPSIEKDFQMNAITLSWVITSFLVASAMFLLPMGKVGDITGIRRLFKIGIVIFTITSLTSGIAQSGTWLIIFRFLQGIGAAFTSTTGPAILVSSFNPRHRGRVLGISVSAVYLGLASGPFIGGILTQYFGWRSIFFATTGVGIISTAIAFMFLGKDVLTNVSTRRIDLKGTFFYMLGLTALVYGTSLIPTIEGWGLMTSGTIFLIIFWRLESKSTAPVLNTKLFTHNRLFAFSNLAALINYSATFAIVFLLSLYLQKIKALSPRDAGAILIAQPITMAIFSPFAGRLSDRIQPRLISTIGMIMCTLGLVSFAFFNENTTTLIIISVLLWVGLGFALFSSPNMNTIMSSVNKHQYGLASGTAATMRVIGQIFSMTIATMFFASFVGKTAIETIPNNLFLQTMRWSFIIFAVISIVGVYFSFGRGKITYNQEYNTNNKP